MYNLLGLLPQAVRRETLLMRGAAEQKAGLAALVLQQLLIHPPCAEIGLLHLYQLLLAMVLLSQHL